MLGSCRATDDLDRFEDQIERFRLGFLSVEPGKIFSPFRGPRLAENKEPQPGCFLPEIMSVHFRAAMQDYYRISSFRRCPEWKQLATQHKKILTITLA